ncbi:hypothetical protein BT69DRAFT_1245328, partial [Atractiella rhizophila]
MQRQRALRPSQPIHRSQPTRAAQSFQSGPSQPSALDESSVPALTSVQRHLEDLERSNYLEPSTGGENREGGKTDAFGDWTSGVASEIAKGRRKKGEGFKGRSLEVRNLLIYRKGFKTLVEESGLSNLPPTTPSYLTAAARPPKYRKEGRRTCASCGYFGIYACGRCEMRYCSTECKTVHEETRCERR